MHYKLLFLTILFLFFSMPIFAIEETPVLSGEEITLDDSIHEGIIETVKLSPYALGNFGGLRTELEEKGINIQSSYMINAFAFGSGENKSGKGTYQGLYNLSIDLDTEKMHLYKGGKFHILYQIGNKGMNSMEFLNSYSDANSYDPTRSINQISELYYEQSIKDDLFNIKIGKQDANMDFQALDTGFEFLNLSFSFIDNTPMPLFPSQQMGVRARVKLPKEFYIQNGFYDGNLGIGSNPKSFFTGENDYLNMTEVYKLTNFNQKNGKYLAGGWIKTGYYEDYESTTKRNNYGFYAGFEQKLTNRFEDKSGGLSLFGQFGYARNSINDVPYYGGGGLIFKGITENRKEDSAGLAFGWHQFDKQLKEIENRTSEKVIELFYKIKLTEFLYLQPDIQYIIKPSGNEKNGFAIGLRSCIVF